MIELNVLAKNLQDGLNANNKGLVFAITSDAGAYVPPKREGNVVTEYINGLVETVGSSVLPIQGLSIATQKVRLEVSIPIDTDERLLSEEVISTVRQVLGDYFATFTVQAIVDSSGNTYTVSVQYTLVDTGSIEQRSRLGESLTFTAYIDYSFIENGLNSVNCTAKLDNLIVPYSTASISRMPVIDNNPYNGSDSSAKSVASTSTLAIEFKLPATDSRTSAVSQAIIDYLLLGGLNERHTLELRLGGNVKTYTVILGDVSIALDGVQNAGYTVSLLEARNV